MASITRELNLLNSRGGRGGRRRESGSNWCFDEFKDEVIRVTPINHESSPTNDRISSRNTLCDSDRGSDSVAFLDPWVANRCGRKDNSLVAVTVYLSYSKKSAYL
jgi:hypothetical protein